MRPVPMLVVVLTLAVPAGAAASGGPVIGLSGAGIRAPGDPNTYVATAAGGATVLQRLAGNTVADYRIIRGAFGVPGAAADGSATGLSADGRTLVLAPAAMRTDRTTLLPIDARFLHRQKPITLTGFYTVDAISPDGRMLYLVHYTRPQTDQTRYEVRAYDLRARRLLPDPIVDPRSPGEKMTGVALTRVTGPGGRWVYTLYAGKEPFVHALDTEVGAAFCIDLDGLGGRDLSSTRLRIDGTVLHVGDQADIDTRTFAVAKAGVVASVAAAPKAVIAPAASAPAPDKRHGLGPVTVAASALVGALILAGALIVRRRRRRLGSPLVLGGDSRA